MYTLYTDKQELFECSISLEGASVKNSQARLIVESDNLNLLFKGTIDSNGKCTVPIKKLKNLLEESTKGKIRLEVIADDTYFTPWESDFEVETAKKVTVEIKSQTNKNTISEAKTGVTVQNVKVGDHIQNLSKMLVKENINVHNMVSNKTKLNNIISSYLKVNKISDGEKGRIIEGIIQTLI
jgi:TusA-related sulfurtransferase